MTKDFPHRPFGQIIVKHGQNFSGTAGTMITRAPWPAPTNKYYVIRKLIVNNMSAQLSGGGTPANLSLAIWDQDLSNTTPVARGSGLLPLISVPLGGTVSGIAGASQGSTMTVLAQDQLPPEYFQAGITVSTTFNGALTQISGIAMTMELEVC